jgi:integrase/recombinase XerD
MPSAAQGRSAARVTVSRGSEQAQAVLGASLPRTISEAGERAAFHSVEFFTARIPNSNTRAAYGHAVAEFCQWCELRAIPLPTLSSPVVAAYFHALEERLCPASANLHLSGIGQWLEWLARTGVLPSNPASVVRGVRLSREEGKTPVLEREQARRLFASLDGADDVVARRDRAILAIMLYGFVRVGAVVRMRVRDFREYEGAASLVLREKGGKERRLPAHHLVREYLRDYLQASGLGELADGRAPLFQSAPRRSRTLSGKALDRSAVLGIVKRRCRDVGWPASICNHSFRATGITLHQDNGGDIEAAARLAGHADTRTTQLYNRTSRDVSRIEIERIHL